MPAEPQDALRLLAEELRAEASVISPYVVEPSEDPDLGLRVAAGPRAAARPVEYALLFETVREGYLLHYHEPRLLQGHDDGLALLAGDYLYARGLERLAALDDLHAVGVLADLISRCAATHTDPEPGAAFARALSLWVEAAESIGFDSRQLS